MRLLINVEEDEVTTYREVKVEVVRGNEEEDEEDDMFINVKR
jgi:hypothetical protein